MTKEEFKAIRKEMELTQKEMAEHLGLTSRAVVYYESGGRLIPGIVAKFLTPLP